MRLPAKYRVANLGEVKIHTLSRRQRQLIEALRRGPVFCASPVRLAPAIQSLRECFGESSIVTDWYESGEGDAYTRYGAYRLAAEVEPYAEKQ